jgi:hypothetical protein
MKCIGTAVHPLPKGEGYACDPAPTLRKKRDALRPGGEGLELQGGESVELLRILRRA